MTTFSLNPNEFTIPGLREIDAEWSLIPDRAVKSMIVVECQSIYFSEYLLESLFFEWNERGTTIRGQLNNSVRAGAIKSLVMTYVSVIEAALRSHAQARGYDLPKNERHRTLGAVLNAWEDAGKNELTSVWDDLQKLKDQRNLVHLYKAAEESKDWKVVLAAEDDLLAASRRVIACAKTIRSS